jgi:anti-sigma regulatory factor (Ser/Thr protein kinase)
MEELIPARSVVLVVTEETQVFEARRIAVKIASDLGWGEEASGKLAIVVTEICTNLVKHAREGQIHVGPCGNSEKVGIEVLAFDRGPGARELESCIRDGFSTSGTPGTGLGAIARLATEFDLFSQPGRGTCLVARIYPERYVSAGNVQPFAVGAVRVPVLGELECGDNWACQIDGATATLLLADGLGHGVGAAEASREAVAVLRNSSSRPPELLIEAIHVALRPTRGAAVAAAQVDSAENRIRFCGIGNISAMVLTARLTQHMVSHNGTAGHHARKIQGFSYNWSPGAVVLMHSDGIATSWRMDTYPGLLTHHPSLLAATLLRDASRGRDDACVVALAMTENRRI